MKYTKLGKSDLTVSRICMGCMGFGDAGQGQHGWTLDEEHSREIIRHGLEMGVNFYDTAIAYQSGTSEQYEIVPETPYTDADLNYGNSKSRTSVEMDDPACRPAIAGELPDLTGYDTVLIGYPIWWGDAPRILSTFVESVDLTDKTLAVFFTSGSSGLGSSMRHLQEQAGTGTWLEGKRFTGRTTVEELVNWANGLGIAP